MKLNFYLVLIFKAVAGTVPGHRTYYVVNGGDLCMACPTNDSVDYEITWLGPPNGMAVAVGTEVHKNYSSAQVKDYNKLCIINISKNYLGNYSCSFYQTNQREEYFFQVLKRIKPKNMVIKPDGTVNVTESQQIVLSCSISKGEPAGVLQWTSGNQILQSSDNSENITITIVPNTNYHGKDYSCQALDVTGLDVLEKDIRINVYGRPVTPTLLKETAMSTSSVTIKWNPLYDGGYPPQSFVVQYRKYRDNSRDEVNNTWLEMPKTYQSHMVLQNLSPGTHYLVRMYACNKINCSEYSPVIMVTTSHSRPSEDSDSHRSGYYALIGIPVVIVAVAVIIYFVKGKWLVV